MSAVRGLLAAAAIPVQLCGLLAAATSPVQVCGLMAAATIPVQLCGLLAAAARGQQCAAMSWLGYLRCTISLLRPPMADEQLQLSPVVESLTWLRPPYAKWGVAIRGSAGRPPKRPLAASTAPAVTLAASTEPQEPFLASPLTPTLALPVPGPPVLDSLEVASPLTSELSPVNPVGGVARPPLSAPPSKVEHRLVLQDLHMRRMQDANTVERQMAPVDGWALVAQGLHHRSQVLQ